MNYWLKWGIFGILFIVVISIVVTPIFCSLINEKNEKGSCSSEFSVYLFLKLYTSKYSFILIIIGFITGSSVGRVIGMLKKKEELISTVKSPKSKKFLWMWEHK